MTQTALPPAQMERVSGNPTRHRTPAEVLSAGATPVAGGAPEALGASAAVYRPGRNMGKRNPKTDRNDIAKDWQVEAYRHVNICGEARYAVSLFSNLASRAEIGVSEPQALNRKAVWVNEGAEADALAEIAPTVRERSALIRNYMTHRVIAGECYLIARERVDTDFGYIPPPNGFEGTWADYIASLGRIDLFARPEAIPTNPNKPVWEIVAVTELRKVGETWSVRHDNNNWIELDEHDPVIRIWTPDPANRREAWSPFRSMLTTLREIEWATGNIFTQIRSRLINAGAWFLPNNLTFPPPPADAVEGGADAMAAMNEAELFMASIAASSMELLDADEVAFPTVITADPAALAAVDQNKLIKFWTEMDDKVMSVRSDAIRRFALGMDLTPEQTLGSSGIAISGSGGSAGSVNHWGEWANEEKTIAGHIEPALDDLCAVLTDGVLRLAVEGTDKVIGYNPATIRMKQDRSKEALAWYQEGVLKASVALSEGGFDPENDMMGDEEFKRWVLTQLVKGSLPPDQTSAILAILTGVKIPVQAPVSGNESTGQGIAGPALPRNHNSVPEIGPPSGDHVHHEAPYAALVASCEGLVLRALEKRGNRLLNEGKRGRDKDRTTPAHLAHLAAGAMPEVVPDEFDFSTAHVALEGMPAGRFGMIVSTLGHYCADLYREGAPYSRETLARVVEGL